MYVAGTCSVLKKCLNGIPAGLLVSGWTPSPRPDGTGQAMGTHLSTRLARHVGGLLLKIHVRSMTL